MLKLGIALGLATLGLTGVIVPHSPDTDRPEIACNADGGKAFAPELTPQQICDQFMAALGSDAGSIRVDLRFSMRGIASANAARLEGSAWQPLPSFELMVMDRRFNTSDIDRLARDVLNGITRTSQSEGD
jgi:hypothetical protein